MYSLTKLEREAELLWLQLQGRVHKAYCDGDHTTTRRLEALSERAFWRLIRRLDMSTKLRRGSHLRRSRLNDRFGICDGCGNCKYLHQTPDGKLCAFCIEVNESYGRAYNKYEEARDSAEQKEQTNESSHL